MDTHLLRSFLHVAELGNLSRASERLHLSQPALSRQIKQLESGLGVALFARTGRGVRLTQAGAILAAKARPILLQLDGLASEVSASAQEVTGNVRLAVPPSFGVGLTIDILESYRARYPKVHVEVSVALSGAVQDGLLEDRLDVGVLYPPMRSRSLESETLWTEQLDLVGAPGLFSSVPISFAQALSYPLLLPSRPHGLRLVVEGYAAQHGGALQVELEVNSLRMLVEMLHRGLGVAFLPRRAVSAELEAGLVSAVSVHLPVLRRQTALAWSAQRPLTQATQLLRDQIRKDASISGAQVV